MNYSFRKGVILAFALRLVLILSVPALSDDFYRYIFDGHLIGLGINPYLMYPSETLTILENPSDSYMYFLFEKMNSPNYFSIYPPLHQFFFYIASLSGEKLLNNILLLRVGIMVFDFLNLYLLYNILTLLGQPISKVWLYAFNPLVVIELTGNLHFEGLVLTGILSLLYFRIKNETGLASLGWSFAIGIKLTPLMLGPLLLRAWKKDKVILFLFLSATAITLFLLPLYFSDGFQKFWQSFRLFQSSFEFNASVYYVIIWLAGFFIDYNPIAYVGPALSLLAFASIVFFSLRFKVQSFDNLALGIVYVYFIYLLSQNVVHPWYIIPAFGVSILTRSNVFLVWTFLVFLSYYAYSNKDFEECTAFLIVEYGILFMFISKEIYFRALSHKIKME